MVYRKCTRHNWCSLRKVSEAGEIKSALPDLNGLPLALVLIISARSLPLRLTRLGAHLGKVIRTPASETAVIVVRASSWLSIRPRAGLLRLRCKSSLLRKPESSLLLLLRRLFTDHRYFTLVVLEVPYIHHPPISTWLLLTSVLRGYSTLS